MNLKEAYEKANNGDLIRRCSFPGQNGYIKSDVLNITVDFESAVADDWEVIPSKKEPLRYADMAKSFNYHEKYSPHEMWFFKEGASAGSENERLVYADLVKECERIWDMAGTEDDRLFKALQKIKDWQKNES